VNTSYAKRPSKWVGANYGIESAHRESRPGKRPEWTDDVQR
jgi:hypothetical protein